MTSSESIAGTSRSGRLYRHSPLVLFAAGFISVVVFQQGLWFVVFPLKGIPVAARFDPAKMAAHVVLHGAWGLGMGLMVRHRA